MTGTRLPAALRWTTSAALLTVGATIAAACGVPTGDDSFDEIPAAEIPVGLRETTTTSSSTTTTVPDAPQTTALPTTTTIALAPVEIYFLSGGRLQEILLDLPRGYGPTQVKDLLEAGPPAGPTGVGLDTLIEPGLIVGIEESGGVLTVDLDPDVFDRVLSFDQSEALGQIVLTMTTNVPRVGLVLFTLGGEPTRVKKGDSQLSEEGEPVSYDDYRILTVAGVPADTTATTDEPAPDESAPGATGPTTSSDPAATTREAVDE